MLIYFSKDPERALAEFHRSGYFVAPNVLSDGFCDSLIAAAQRFSSAVEGHFRPVMHPHLLDPLFMRALSHPEIVVVMNSILRGKVDGLQTEFFYGRPGVRGFAPHQDNFFVEAEDSTFASAWIALTDVGPDNGGLYGFPGTHALGRLPVRRLQTGTVEGQDPNANNEETVIPDGFASIDITAPKGSVVFLHAYFVHGSHINTSSDYRYALLCTYIREGAHYRSGRYAQRAAIPLTFAQDT